MRPAAKLSSYAVVLVAVLGGGAALGSAVGPIDIGGGATASHAHDEGGYVLVPDSTTLGRELGFTVTDSTATEPQVRVEDSIIAAFTRTAPAVRQRQPVQFTLGVPGIDEDVELSIDNFGGSDFVAVTFTGRQTGRTLLYLRPHADVFDHIYRVLVDVLRTAHDARRALADALGVPAEAARW